MADNDDLKYGINWSFLKSLLDMYEQMLNDQHTFIKSTSGSSNISPKVAYANFAASIYTLYTSVKHQYDKYLNSNESKIKPSDYISILTTIKVNKSDQDYAKILKLSVSLSEWTNSKGPFRTLTKDIDPLNPNNM